MATRFLAAFNDVENHLRERLHAEPHHSVSELSRRGLEKRLLTPRQSGDLLTLASLRNALVHGRHFGDRAIAEPVPEVVEAVEKLCDRLLRPALARDVLRWSRPATFPPNAPLSSVLAFAAAHRYSQFPVTDTDRGYLGLLTTDGIAMWLGVNLSPSDVGLIEDVHIEVVLPLVEQRDEAIFVGSDITASDAITKLQQGGPQGQPAAALLVTNSGKRRERLLGLITSADLPRLVAAAE